MKRSSVSVLVFAFVAVLTASAQEKAKFTVECEVPRLDVVSQDQTGTCWSYATTSFLESEMERIHKKKIDLSEMYQVYNAYLEKCRRYVRLQGKAQFSEGGLSHDVIAMVKLAGIVPADAFTGLCDGDRIHSHGEMAGVIETLLKHFTADPKKNQRGPKFEKLIRGILDVYIGTPPATITVDGKSITPKQYADDVLKVPYDDYVEIMSFGYTPFWENGELLVPDNWMRYAGYKNLPVDAMMDCLDHALKSGYSVAADMDVSERGFQMGNGTAKLPEKLEKAGAVTQESRDKAFDTGETQDDHLMHIVGIAKDPTGAVYYMTKNSWGKTGAMDGYIYMSRNFVAMKMLGMMVHKDGLPPAIKEKVKL
jgi:bleomycin hydrolase